MKKYTLDLNYGVYEIEEDNSNPNAVAFKVSKNGELIVEGYVKWDGCSNWKFNSEECMLHFCSRGELEELGKLLSQLWDNTSKTLPNFQGDINSI